MTYQNKTITAITTPLGSGGVGIIRISGDDSLEILKKLFSKSPNKKLLPTFVPNMAQHGWILDDDTLIDEVLVLYFKSPNSYTGEDIVEINCHGGMNIVRNILNLTLKHGAVMAERGEFTKRAFLNGKMDLSQAEAVLDVIHSKTDKFSKISAHNLSGTLSNYIKTLRLEIMELLAKITAAIDFPEDVLEPEYDFIEDKLNTFITKIDKALSSAKSSNLMRQGLKIAIIGQTNVGKSSLFNTLLDSQRAIVTNIAGTTRDVIQESLDVAGIPVTLMDTAGLRELENNSDSDVIESIGIDFSKKCLEEADLVLFMYDLSKGLDEEDMKILPEVDKKAHLKIGSKADLADILPKDVLCISTKTLSGIEELKKEIKTQIINQNKIEDNEFSTNLRQQECLTNSKIALEHALNGTKIRELQDLISIDVKSALLHLDEITGEVMTDEILTHIFEQFCIGK
jgi:tRNA modification GTPase